MNFVLIELILVQKVSEGDLLFVGEDIVLESRFHGIQRCPLFAKCLKAEEESGD